MRKLVARLCLCASALTALDQAIKIIISRFYFSRNVAILPGWVSFAPVQNTNMSWFGSLGMGLFANYHVTVGVNVAVFVAAVLLFRYIVGTMGVRNRLAQATFALLFAATACSTIDRVVWGGSIDYIRLEGLFAFDLKDAYMTAFEVLFVGCAIVFHKKWERFRLRDWIGDWRRKGR